MRLSSSKTSDGEFKTLEGGHTLHLAVKHDDLAPLNKPVYLAIRPEHVQLNGAAPRIPCPDTFARSFSPGQRQPCVDANGLLLEALVLRTDGLEINQPCNVTLSPDHLTVLK